MNSRIRVWVSRVRYVWVRTGILILIALPFVMFITFRAQGFDDSVLLTTADVRVDREDDAIAFRPRSPLPTRLMLLPGCPVDPLAYAPLARDLARRGFEIAIVRIPYRCAPLPQHEAEVFARVQRITARVAGEPPWVLIGHSRGAAHALRVLDRGPAEIGAVVLMGTTHPRDRDYSASRVRFTKIVATEDGVAPVADSAGNRGLLPASTRWVVINEGNHAQFAHYGFQLFDGRARISREAQQSQAVAAIVEAATFGRLALP
jgi:hypothetical protein